MCVCETDNFEAVLLPVYLFVPTLINLLLLLIFVFTKAFAAS